MALGCLVVFPACKRVPASDVQYPNELSASIASGLNVFSEPAWNSFLIEDDQGIVSREAVDAALSYAKNQQESKIKFVNYGYNFSVFSGDAWYRFFPKPVPTKVPGICSVRSFVVTERLDGEKLTRTGEWTGPFFGIVGSTKPRAKPWSKSYIKELNDACNFRSDTKFWFSAENQDEVVRIARLAELTILAARKDGRLPFEVSCHQYMFEREEGIEVNISQCKDTARFTLGSIDPRTIVAFEECRSLDFNTAADPNCIAIRFPKTPKLGAIATDQWTLDITAQFPADNYDKLPRVESVRIHDTQIIIE